MKSDIVVGNPPYGYGGGGDLHLKIMNSLLKFCTDKLNFIMPSKPIIERMKDRWYTIALMVREE